MSLAALAAETNKQQSSNRRTFSRTPPRVLEFPQRGGETLSFIRGEQIGTGGFARCYLVKEKNSGISYACKVVDKESIVKPKAKSKMRSEIQIHKRLHHTNVVQVEHVFESTDFVFIVMELCPNQTLHELIKRKRQLTEPEARFYMTEIIQGLKYIHAQNIIHRDLKLGNLMLDGEMGIKIGDFGLATKVDFQGQRKKTICGTPNYIAPEILTRASNGHSFEVDVWSLGVVLYTLVVGKPPFQTKSARTTYRRIRENAYTFPSSPALSSDLKSLIAAMLCTDPGMRPSLEALEKMAWMSGPSQPAAAPTPEERELTASSRSHTREEAWQSKDVPSSGTLNRPTTRSVANASTSTKSTLGKRRAADADLDKENQLNARPVTRSVTASRPRKQAKLSEEVKPWVHKWIDYSTKYGLAFQLSDGCMGVFFNDNSKIVTTPELGSVQYLEADGKEVEFMTADNYPERMKKKVELLKYFREHFLVGAPLDTLPGPIRVHDGKELLPLVSSWRHTRSAMVFDVDQGSTLQVNFFDHSKVFLFPKQSALRFVDRVRNVHFHDLNHKLDCPSASRRLTYLQRVFTTRYPELNYEMVDEEQQQQQQQI